MLHTFTRDQAEMVVRNPESYPVNHVHAAGCWTLGYLDISPELLQLACMATRYARRGEPT